MENLIYRLSRDNPELTFVKGKLLCWSPKEKQIFYNPKACKEDVGGLLHEIGHARLKHRDYCSDVDLLKKEALAWQEALILAKSYSLPLDSDHIQDCLDSYRDWLHKRSTCPACRAKGLQQTVKLYVCINCRAVWQVTQARFCRPYRRRQ